MRAVRSGR